MLDSQKKVKIIALICGVFAALLGLFYVKLNAEKTDDMVPIIEAAVTIPGNTRITEDMLTVKDVPVDDAVEGATTSADAVVGKFAGTTIYKGEAIVTSRIVDQGSDSVASFAYKIPDGMRTATLQVDASSAAANLIQVGDHVDVIATHTGADGKTATKYVASYVQVAALDTSTVRAASNGKSDQQSNTSYATVTLYVTKDLARQIAYEKSAGDTLTLTLRNPNDTQNADNDAYSEANYEQTDASQPVDQSPVKEDTND